MPLPFQNQTAAPQQQPIAQQQPAQQLYDPALRADIEAGTFGDITSLGSKKLGTEYDVNGQLDKDSYNGNPYMYFPCENLDTRGNPRKLALKQLLHFAEHSNLNWEWMPGTNATMAYKANLDKRGVDRVDAICMDIYASPKVVLIGKAREGSNNYYAYYIGKNE